MTIEEFNEYFKNKSDKHGYYEEFINFHEKEKLRVGSGDFLNPVMAYVILFPDDFEIIGYTGGCDVTNKNVGVFRENNLDINKFKEYDESPCITLMVDIRDYLASE